MWPVVQFYFSNMSSPVSVRIWIPSSAIAAGGISVEQSFTNSGGNIIISNSSSAEAGGGAVLRSSSWIFGI